MTIAGTPSLDAMAEVGERASAIRLVINADDLGLHSQIDAGILAGHAEGVVTSASVLATGPSAATAVRRAVAQGLPLGVHLCLSTHLTPAAPPQAVRWLAPGGRFRKDWAELAVAWLARLIPAEEVEFELRAQVERARELGAVIDHLDTHQHLELLPGLGAIVQALGAELDLPVRWPGEGPQLRWLVHPRAAVKTAAVGALARALRPRSGARVRVWGAFEAGRLSERRLVRIVRGLGAGEHELVVHPGLSPGVVPQDPRWKYEWEGELGAVLSPRVRDVVRARGVELVSHRGLRSEAVGSGSPP